MTLLYASRFKSALLFGAMLLTVSLSITPVWPGEQIYGRAIGLALRWGTLLPGSIGRIAPWPGLVKDLIQVYRGLNLLHYAAVSAFIVLFTIHWIRTRRKAVGCSSSLWLALGLLLLVFPGANLVISEAMFFTPGVLGTAFASAVVLIAGGVLK